MTHTAFDWTLSNGGDSVRFVLVANVVVSIESSEVLAALQWRHRAFSWTSDTDEEAREQALTQTWIWEERGYAWEGAVRTAEVDVHLPGLTMECMMVEGIGPILAAVVTTLERDGTVLHV